MGKRSKRKSSILYMQRYESLFSCPICHQTMKVFQEGDLKCEKNHTFTIAKQGYVNFLTKQSDSKYSKTLFESRKNVIDSGLYSEMHDEIARLIGKRVDSILDTGCGEGSHLNYIRLRLQPDIALAGIDISKEGIMCAAKYYEQTIWCVGDLANSPFQEKSFDVILNILSPANYDEFKRLLRTGGKVIKVMPQTNYLKELREQVYASSEKEQYSNNQVVERFQENFLKVTKHRITYTKKIEEELVPKLLEMTPLGWHIDPSTKISLDEITIDLDVLVGEM